MVIRIRDWAHEQIMYVVESHENFDTLSCYQKIKQSFQGRNMIAFYNLAYFKTLWVSAKLITDLQRYCIDGDNAKKV